MDRRHQRGERTRRALVGAALDLFEQNGFDAVTVDEIAVAADVSPRTFFHHFQTKEGVLFEGYAERLNEATQRFRDTGPDRPVWFALEQASTAVADAIADKPELFMRRSRLYAHEVSLRATMLRINEEWIDGIGSEIAKRLGTSPPDLRPRLMAAIANSAMRAAIDAWAASGGIESFEDLAHETFEMIRPAITQIEQQPRKAKKAAERV